MDREMYLWTEIPTYTVSRDRESEHKNKLASMHGRG